MASIENQAKQWLDIMQRNAPKAPERRDTTVEGPEHDDLGRAVHYNLEDHPPGSVIQSKVVIQSRTRYNAERHGEVEMATPGYCAICDFEFTLKSVFKKHKDDEHDGDAMWANRTGVIPKPVVRNNSLKPTKSHNIDPHGRTIYGTPDQLAAEAKRHGVTIVDGAGSS